MSRYDRPAFPYYILDMVKTQVNFMLLQLCVIIFGVYVFAGVVAFLCWVLFMYVAYNSPDEHPRITEAERMFIKRSIAAPKYDKVCTVGTM